MRTVGMVIARAGSTRVPGKALLELRGQPVLWHVIRIAKQISGLDSLVLATTTAGSDDALDAIARAHGIPTYRGDPEKVLDRVHAAAVSHGADTIVYVGGDCPLLDPVIISDAIDEFRQASCDYLCNYDPPTFPSGLDVNIIAFAALDRAFRQAVAPSQRMHAFSYLTFHADEFRIMNFARTPDVSTYHWSLDYPEDIVFLRLVYERLYRPDAAIRMQEVLDLIARDPIVREHHDRLRKPAVAHAFLSSPGMMRDINADIESLCRTAGDAIGRADYAEAKRCYNEIRHIAEKLSH